MESQNVVYRKLQEHIDHLPVGYPADKSGLDIDILKGLFTEEEAKVAIELSMLPESLDRIYPRLKKLGYSKEEAEEMLDQMYKKGLIMGGEAFIERQQEKGL